MYPGRSHQGRRLRQLDRYFGLKEDLEDHFGRGVDLVMEGAVAKNSRFAESVAETRVPLYAA